MDGLNRYCILRVEKIRGAGRLKTVADHCLRSRVTPNADPARLKSNTVIVGFSSEEVMASSRERFKTVPRKIRKDAVLAVEYFIGCSKGVLAEAKETAYCRQALEWIKARHGKENLVQATIHRDEGTNTHLHAVVIPIVEMERKTKHQVHREPALRAAYFFDGSEKLSKMQTHFADRVGKPFDLERGIMGSKARHERVSRFYGAMESPVPELPTPTYIEHKVLRDANEEIKANITDDRERIAPVIAQLQDQARMAKAQSKKIEDLRQAFRQKDRQIGELQREVKQLREELTKAQQWIQKAQEAVITGGQKFKDWCEGVIAAYRAWREQKEKQRKERGLER